MRSFKSSWYPPLLAVILIVIAFAIPAVWKPGASFDSHKLSVALIGFSPPNVYTVSVTPNGALHIDTLLVTTKSGVIAGMPGCAALAINSGDACESEAVKQRAWTRTTLATGIGAYAPERRNWRLRGTAA